MVRCLVPRTLTDGLCGPVKCYVNLPWLERGALQKGSGPDGTVRRNVGNLCLVNVGTKPPCSGHRLFPEIPA